jgi:DNA-binding beta-propeller fold protein YncE
MHGRQAQLMMSGLAASLLCTLAVAGETNQTQRSDAHPVSLHVARADNSVDGKSEPTLFFLKLRGGVQRTSITGNNNLTLVPFETAGSGPDGIAVDVANGHVYWTNMGKVSLDDGSVMRADLDGRNLTTIVDAGGTFTPKQLKLDPIHRKLYWSDREGMRVMRSNLDGTKVETLVETGSGDADRKDAAHWCVGIAIDTRDNKVYWSQKGGDNANKGTIKRASLDLPAGQTAANRTDIEVLFADLPEPIDLDLDATHRLLYWTDRGDNTISRTSVDAHADATQRKREILVRNVGEAIGVTLDVERDRLYYTSLDGVIGSAKLDGSNAQKLVTDAGALTGIVVADIRKR